MPKKKDQHGASPSSQSRLYEPIPPESFVDGVFHRINGDHNHALFGNVIEYCGTFVLAEYLLSCGYGLRSMLQPTGTVPCDIPRYIGTVVGGAACENIYTTIRAALRFIEHRVRLDFFTAPGRARNARRTRDEGLSRFDC